MLKPQLPNTCNTFLTDISNYVNVKVLRKDFYHRPLNVAQILTTRHKPFRFLGIVLSCNASQAFVFFQDDKDVLVLDTSLRIFEKRPSPRTVIKEVWK